MVRLGVCVYLTLKYPDHEKCCDLSVYVCAHERDSRLSSFNVALPQHPSPSLVCYFTRQHYEVMAYDSRGGPETSVLTYVSFHIIVSMYIYPGDLRSIVPPIHLFRYFGSGRGYHRTLTTLDHSCIA